MCERARRNDREKVQNNKWKTLICGIFRQMEDNDTFHSQQK